MMPKSLLNPLAETLAKVKLMMPNFDGEAPSRNISERVVDEAEVKARPRRNVDERVVDDFEVGVEPLNNGSLIFQ